jgi:hypothetical protein
MSSEWTASNIPGQTGRVAIVTGANSSGANHRVEFHAF